MGQPGARPFAGVRLAVVVGLALLLVAPAGAAAGGGGIATDVDRAGDSGALVGSAQYRQAEEHAGDVIDFEPGGLVRVPFTPRPNDDWTVDGAGPRALPPGLATGRQMRDAPAGEA